MLAGSELRKHTAHRNLIAGIAPRRTEHVDAAPLEDSPIMLRHAGERACNTRIVGRGGAARRVVTAAAVVVIRSRRIVQRRIVGATANANSDANINAVTDVDADISGNAAANIDADTGAGPAAADGCIDIAGDEYRVGRPFVFKRDGLYRMFYCAGTAERGYRLTYAESVDGIDWVRKHHEAGIDVSPSGWDSEMQAYPSVLQFRDKTYMFYNGNNYGEQGFGYAVLESW